MLLSNPEPTDIIKKVIWWAKKIDAANKAKDDPYVFEYNDSMPKDKAYLMDRNQFEDMRYRVFLSSEWKPTIEEALAKQ